MRAVWSLLVVLVLLAPFGRVGITASVETDAVTMPREGENEVRSVVVLDEPAPAARFVLGDHGMCVSCFVRPASTFVTSAEPHGAYPSMIESLAVVAPSARGPPA